MIEVGQLIWINVNPDNDSVAKFVEGKVIRVEKAGPDAHAMLEVGLADGNIWRTSTGLFETVGYSGWMLKEPQLPDTQADVVIHFTVTRPNAFNILAEAGRVVGAELTKLPGSKLVELSVGPAHDYVEVIHAGSVQRQWTAVCKAVLARG